MARRTLLAGAICALAAAVAVPTIHWYSHGPGLEGEVDRLVSLTRTRPGMAVAEIGAGQGGMAVRMVRRLGASGRLSATEIEAEKLSAIRSAAVAAGLANVTVLQVGEHSTNLPEACCDVIYMRRVYHHLTDPAAIGKSLHAALRPGGRLAVIDLRTPRSRFLPSHGVAPEVVIAQLTSAGFTLDQPVGRWSLIDYCLVFRKAAQKL